jgi:hypothetical protein
MRYRRRRIVKLSAMEKAHNEDTLGRRRRVMEINAFSYSAK